MIDLKRGDRVEIIKDAYGDCEHLVGQFGVVIQPARYYQGELATGFDVLLDGHTELLEFMPEELEGHA